MVGDGAGASSFFLLQAEAARRTRASLAMRTNRTLAQRAASVHRGSALVRRVSRGVAATARGAACRRPRSTTSASSVRPGLRCRDPRGSSTRAAAARHRGIAHAFASASRSLALRSSVEPSRIRVGVHARAGRVVVALALLARLLLGRGQLFFSFRLLDLAELGIDLGVAGGEAGIDLLELGQLVVAQLEITSRIDQVADRCARGRRQRRQLAGRGMDWLGIVVAGGQGHGEDEHEPHGLGSSTPAVLLREHVARPRRDRQRRGHGVAGDQIGVVAGRQVGRRLGASPRLSAT